MKNKLINNVYMVKKFNSTRSHKGAVMAEAALVIPLLIGITFVITEFGNILYISNSLNQIARTMARYASVSQNYTNAGLLSSAGAGSVLDTTKISITITPAAWAARSVGDTITVSLTYNYTPIVNPYRFFNANSNWAPNIRTSAISRSEVKQYP